MNNEYVNKNGIAYYKRYTTSADAHPMKRTSQKCTYLMKIYTRDKNIYHELLTSIQSV